MIKIHITEKASRYLLKLTQRPENQGKSLYLKAHDPETPYAEACLEFMEIGPKHADDFLLGFEGFSIFVNRESKEYLDDATIDIKQKELRAELHIETPHLKPLSMVDENAPLFDRVAWVIETDINPSLASHGGAVRLVEITEDGIVKLQFAGGCQGCDMADVTLKQGITATLMEKFSEINDVEDITNHADGVNPYF